MSLNHAMNEYAKKLLEQSRTPQERVVPPKIYFHHHNYAKFHFDMGGSRVKSIAFANYRYITDDKLEQDQLDLVADVPGSFVYTMKDSDVDAVIRNELQNELNRDILRTAQAHAAVNNQQYDPNAPIIPVQVQHVQQTPMQVAPVVQQSQPAPVGAVVGLQNSFSGTQATSDVGAKPTTPENQTKPPSAADAAAARLAAAAAEVGKQP